MDKAIGRALDAVPAILWTALPDGHIDFVNRRWSEYTGLTLDDANGREWQVATNSNDTSELLKRWRSILASGESGEMETRVRRSDGQYRRFVVHSSPMHDDGGRIVRWCSLGTGVKDLRRAQDIMNLLRNAVDAMNGVDDRPKQLVIRSALDEDNQVRMSVEDAGVGFESDDAERLFEAFYTTKSNGMRIGLSVSRSSIIEGHRGRLWAASNAGRGATFSFSIPVSSRDGVDVNDARAARVIVTSSVDTVTRVQ